MNIHVNDAPFETELTTLIDILKSLNVDQQRIVVLIDDTPIEKSAWQHTEVKPEQRLELLEFVGGG